MIYTIGYGKSYRQALIDNGKVIKLGKRRCCKRFPEGYSGGYAFKSIKDAKKRIKEQYRGKGFVVFGLKAKWSDTKLAKDGWWNHLLKDSEVVFL